MFTINPNSPWSEVTAMMGNYVYNPNHTDQHGARLFEGQIYTFTLEASCTGVEATISKAVP